MILVDFGIGLCVLLLSGWLTKCLSSPLSKVHYLDHPNSRSLHLAPTPRTGGLAIFASLTMGILLLMVRATFFTWHGGVRTSLGIFGALLLLAFTSFLDDRSSLLPFVRFA